MVFALTIVLQSKPVQSEFGVMLVKFKFYYNHYNLYDETFINCVKLNGLYGSIYQYVI